MEKEKTRNAGGRMTTAQDFEEWYAGYPRKVGKLAAQKAYARARKLATAKELREGVGRYIANKPSYADFCHPASWLNAGRWADEYGPVSMAAPKIDRNEMDDYHRFRRESIERQKASA